MRTLRTFLGLTVVLTIPVVASGFLDSAGTPACGNTSEPPNPTVAVLHGVLTDNGDDDGWADTSETVQMRLSLLNRLDFDLTGLVAYLTTDDPKIDCISDPVLRIGDLAAGESRLTGEAFTFRVADVARTTVAEEFSVVFAVAMSSDQFNELPIPQWIALDLDLDVSGGSGPTTFFEGFESGFGAFTTMHLDADLNPPDGDLRNDEAGLLNSDGYRCQYTDPDWRISNSYGQSTAPTCYLNPTGVPDLYWFDIVDDRAYNGARSLHWGLWMGAALGYTTPIAQLEAIRTREPVNLGWDKHCQAHPWWACETDVVCPIGDVCDYVAPMLSFTHQISFWDHRTS